MPAKLIRVTMVAWCVCLALVAPVMAADDQPLEAPPLPPPVQSGESLEPEVTIRKTPRETIYEYRRNGQLVLVRVLPRIGPPYHFVDTDGDGSLDYQPGEPVNNRVNQWLLFSW